MTNKPKARYHKVYYKKKLMGVLGMVFRYTLLISLGFVILTPLLKLLKEALTEQSALGMKNSVWIPAEISDQSFLEAYHILNYAKAIVFSLLNTAVLMILQMMCAALAAYSFARLKFKGSNLLFGVVVFTIIVPSQSIMLAQYTSFRNFDILGIFKLITGEPLNLVGSTVAIYILAATGMGVKGGLYIYILRQAIRNLPESIEEAAYVDGAGFLKTFFRIVIPGCSSALTTVGVLSFVWNYADVYFMSLLSPTNLHLPLKLTRVQTNMMRELQDIYTDGLLPDSYLIQWDSPIIQSAVAAACALLVILPLLILYLFIQKRFVQGVERSGLGGD